MRTLALRALAWIDERRDQFRLETPSIERVKRLGELAILASVVEPVGGERLAWAWQQLGAGEAIAALAAEQPAIGCVYVPFRRAGLRSAAVERRLADPASRQRVGDAHWFVRYAVGVALQTIGVAPPWRMAHQAFTTMRDPEMAAHVVMWRTVMGLEPYALAEDERRQLAVVIARWCPVLVAAGEWDALAEVAIAASCARLAVPDLVWHALAGAQRDDGSLPLRRGAGGGFAASYHATLVTAIASALETEAPAWRATAARLAGEAWAEYGD